MKLPAEMRFKSKNLLFLKKAKKKILLIKPKQYRENSQRNFSRKFYCTFLTKNF